MTTLLNNGFSYRARLGPDEEKLTLLDYLSQRYCHSTAEAWTEHIASGRVLVDGAAVPADTRLRRGAEVVWNRPAWIEPDCPRTFDVLYEDDDLLAVAKPAGLPTLPGGNFLEGTLLHLVRRYRAGTSPLHRLGRWTSGLVLCAANARAGAELTRQWSGREIGKRYRALASGLAGQDVFTITASIGPAAHPLLGTVHAASAAGRPALSRVSVLEQRQGSFLCDVLIATGRPHQIRIHLAAAGHPLAGDPLYGPGGVPLPDTQALPGDPGYLLHAAELRFRHPSTGRETVIRCEPPEELRTEAEASSCRRDRGDRRA